VSSGHVTNLVTYQTDTSLFLFLYLVCTYFFLLFFVFSVYIYIYIYIYISGPAGALGGLGGHLSPKAPNLIRPSI
jgi:hypothetical protein